MVYQTKPRNSTENMHQLYLQSLEEVKELTKMKKFKIAGSNYVPSILIRSATLTCIFEANFRTRVTTKDANFVFG